MTLEERIDELEAELAVLRAEVRELRRQRTVLLESRDHWMNVADRANAGGAC